jgi:threonyl-tRNA synthetase
MNISSFRKKSPNVTIECSGQNLDCFCSTNFHLEFHFTNPKGQSSAMNWKNLSVEVSYGEGYKEIRLPQLFDAEIFKTSGHWDHFKQDMFTLKVEGRDYALKPMNCPGHMALFGQGFYSYRDLPLRFAEMSTLYRNELSGALGGLTRTRAFAQDDCHIFLAPDQISDEVTELLGRIQKIFKVFNMKIEDVVLSTKPEQSLGTKEEWDNAEKALAAALKKAKWKFEINAGDGAFYGPKIDMRIKDVLGRKWQLATIQLDFQMPARFKLEYTAKDGSKKTPIVIHRALLGSFERFLGILIEHFGGNFPTWLAPVQAQILPISEKQNKYAAQVLKNSKKMESGPSSMTATNLLAAKSAKPRCKRFPTCSSSVKKK